MPDKSNDERLLTMTRCGNSGSVHMCHCEPRFTDMDAGPDWSCLKPTEVTYVAVDALLSDDALTAATNTARMSMMEADGLREAVKEIIESALWIAGVDATTGNEVSS